MPQERCTPALKLWDELITTKVCTTKSSSSGTAEPTDTGVPLDSQVNPWTTPREGLKNGAAGLVLSSGMLLVGIGVAVVFRG